MAEELADTHAQETAEIGANSGGDIGRDTSNPDKPLSLRETLNKSVEEVREKERVRDEQGKFAKEKPANAEKPAAAASNSPPSQGEKVADSASETPQASKPVGPPPGWSPASKEFFNSLAPDHPLRQDVLKREEEVSNGFKSYSDKTKQYDAIEQAIAPNRARYQQAGLKSDAEAVNRLFQWESAIASNPIEGIQRLARSYGVDLSQIAQQSPAPSDGGQDIPQYLKPVLDRFGQLEQQVTGVLTSQQQSESNRITAELAAFAKDKPHFEKVRVAMGQMMTAGIVPHTDLDDAYQRAIWADPDLRQQLLREQDDKRKAEFAKTQLEAGKNARLAAVSPAPRARQAAPVNGVDKSAKGVRGSILAAVHELREDQRA
jgi:hypothetical protein